MDIASGFPENFIWGAATSAYQIEGGAAADGKGRSVWDRFCQQPEAVWEGHTGDTACDHYRCWRQDIALMEDLGLQAYRFSVSWPRVIPGGAGPANPKGLDFYDRLVDGLLAAGILPYLTIFHWDYPEELYRQGGWLHPDSPNWFADYTLLLADRLSDRVVHWITLNEPQVHIGMGHYWGRHAPGDTVALPEMLRMMHHSLLAHGKAVQVLRARAIQPLQIGFASAAQIYIPASDSPADIEAARQRMFAVTPDTTIWNNAWFSDPLYWQQYPAGGLALFGPAMPEVPAADLETIAQPLDFYAFNAYSGTRVRRGEDGQPQVLKYPPGQPMMMNQWFVNPEILYWGPKFFWERYRLPVVITENGMSNVDWVAADGCIHDPQRIDYVARHLEALQRGLAEGVDVRGYFYWSLFDNFEWAEGYKQRFGLVYVDFQDQTRILKDSALWYKGLIQARPAKH